MFRLLLTDEELLSLKESSKTSRAGANGLIKVPFKAMFNIFVDNAKLMGEKIPVEVLTSDRDYDKLAKIVNGKVGSSMKFAVPRKLLDNLISDHDEMFALVEKVGKRYSYIPR